MSKKKRKGKVVKKEVVEKIKQTENDIKENRPMSKKQKARLEATKKRVAEEKAAKVVKKIVKKKVVKKKVVKKKVVKKEVEKKTPEKKAEPNSKNATTLKATLKRSEEATEKKRKKKDKKTHVSIDKNGKGRSGQVVGLTDIYDVLIEIRDLLKGGSSGKMTGKRKRTKAEKDQIKKELLVGMPYKKKDIDDMTGVKVRMLGAALGMKTFGVHPDKIRTAILKKK